MPWCWQTFRDSLTRYGIDAWWFDATEPENDDLHVRWVDGGRLPGDFYRNVYPLMVNRTMYQGLTTVTPQPVILTRSAFAGMQRYGVVTWSGDVGTDYEEALRQDCEYMFGPRYLVCPTLQGGITSQRVYLPPTEGGWRHFFTGTHYEGGQYIDCPVTLETMAVFERER